MEHHQYPALFLDADKASNAYQRNFLTLIRAEYFTLLLASVLSLSFFSNIWFYVAYTGIFILGLIILITRAQGKTDQWWYRCRALAESVKTLTWRYMMHATPFDVNEQEAKKQFRDQLHSVFRENPETAMKITEDWSGNDQITTGMKSIRVKSREERLSFYLKNRVEDQRNWYKNKSKSNRSAAKIWFSVSAACYIAAGLMALSRIALPDWPYWPIEPIIVLAASVIGWMQIKKFNELSAAYTVTAHEIGLILAIPEAITDDSEFSEFVNDAEKAFSREHTLWIARQSD